MRLLARLNEWLLRLLYPGWPPKGRTYVQMKNEAEAILLEMESDDLYGRHI